MNRLPNSLEKLTEVLGKLPGIGKKSALRLSMHLANNRYEMIPDFVKALESVKSDLKFCKHCGNFSDNDICEICIDPKRDTGVLCIVESVKDLIAIEETGQYQGKYHILGGLISPIDGIGPEELNISSLMTRVEEEGINELIMAISSTIEGDTTLFYLSRQFRDNVKISAIARGVSFGGELEYADEFTLGRAIHSRLPVQNIFNGEG
ncbi:recombination mediator RecR [Membranihabitans maritimus]|uniref:recombination mediator RecR n=1 Tax=Membranihabitans maritimus TaxID=2904244 RepID=UPI001F0285BB|nr:recombination mediator RecR [Membranihabitans maritimus]